VRQVRAEADQAIAQALGAAEAARQRAQGEADAVLIRARADAKANEIIRYSTTALVLQYRAIEHWDGKLPLMNGGSLPLLTFDVSKLGGTDADRDKRLRELLAETAPAPKAAKAPPEAQPGAPPAPPPAPAASDAPATK
jgi:hypothetical protein